MAVVVDVRGDEADVASRRPGLVAAVAWTGGAAGFSLFRYALVADPSDHVWWEDGAVFVTEATSFGSVLEPYAGYLQVPLRLVALMASLLPLAWTPAIFVLTSAAVVGVGAAVAWRASAEVVDSTAWRVVVAAAFPALPLMGDVPVLTLSYMQWVLIPAAVWSLFLPRRLRWVTVAIVVLTLLMSLVAIVALVPAVLVRGWHRSNGAGYVLPLVLSHAPAALSRDRIAETRGSDLVEFFVSDVGGGILSTSDLPLAAAVTVLAAIGVGAAENRNALTLFVPAAVLLPTLAVLGGVPASRYSLPCAVLLVGAAGVAFQRVPALALVVLTAWAFSLPATTYANAAASWSHDVASAPCIEGERVLRVGSLQDPDWHARVSCESAR